MMFGAALASLTVLPACDGMKKKEAPAEKSERQLAAERNERIRKACASAGTYDRLKELVFDEAARIRNSDPRNLDPLAAASVVRMEQPLVKSRDEDLNVTVCTGRFILELPQGAENAFDGMRRLDAEVEYAAQAAADGSGMVYQMDGAEPIIYRLATFGLSGAALARVVELPQPSAPPGAPPEVVLMDRVEPRQTAPAPSAAPQPAAKPAAAPRPAAPQQTPPAVGTPAAPTLARPAPAGEAKATAPAAQRGSARPSFNCRYGRTSTEKMVCSSPVLASKDRQMASIYYAAMASADPGTRSHLRRSRDAFLAKRERCGSEACVTAAYNARIAEIRSIASGR
jgi:alkylhydroperoxidase/carboxymuconolactone decarboxylase family protein YurZ